MDEMTLGELPDGFKVGTGCQSDQSCDYGVGTFRITPSPLLNHQESEIKSLLSHNAPP